MNGWPNQDFHQPGCKDCSIALHTRTVCPRHCPHTDQCVHKGTCNQCGADLKRIFGETWEHQKEGELHAEASADVPERPAISIPESNNAMGVHGTMPCGCVFSPCFLCTRTAASERAQRLVDEQAQKQADAEDTRTLAGDCAGLVEGSKAVLNTVCTATNELYRPGGGGFDEIKFEKAKAKDLFDAWKRQLGTLGVSGVSDVPEAIKNLRDAKENGPVGGRIEVQHAELCDALDKVLDLVETMHKSRIMPKKLFKGHLQTMKRHLNSLSDVLESVQARTVPSQTPAPALAKPPKGEAEEAEEAEKVPVGKRHYDFVEILLIELSGEGVHPDEISSLYTELHCTGLSTLKKLCEERPDCMDSVVAKLWGLATRIGVDPFSETWNKELAPYTTCDESSCTQRYEAMVGHDMKLNQTLDRLKAHMFLFTFMAWWHTRSAEGGSQADRKLQQMSQRLQWILGTLYIRSDFYELRLKRTAIATVSMALSKPFHDKLSSMLGKDRSVADWAASHTRQWAPIILKAHFVTYFRPIFDHMETFGSLSSLNSAVSDAINKFDAEHGSALHDVMVVMAKMTEIQGACTNMDSMTPSDRVSAKQTLVKMINAALKEVHNATFDKHDMTFQFYTVHCKPTFESVAKVITSKTGDATARYEAVYNPSKQKSADDFKIGDSAAFFKKTEFAFERFNCASSSHGNVSSSALLIYGAKKASGKAPVS